MFSSCLWVTIKKKSRSLSRAPHGVSGQNAKLHRSLQADTVFQEREQSAVPFSTSSATSLKDDLNLRQWARMLNIWHPDKTSWIIPLTSIAPLQPLRLESVVVFCFVFPPPQKHFFFFHRPCTMCLLAVAQAIHCICGMAKTFKGACRPKCMLLISGSEFHRGSTGVFLRDLI